MLANIRPVVDGTPKDENDGGGPPPKMALISGHDSTLQPLLASLGDDVWDGTIWTPYASTFLIEIHKLKGDDPTFKGKPKTMFRLIYNGEALTSRVDGCPVDSDLCDASILINLVTPFAKIVDRDCKSSLPKDGAYSSILATEELLTTPGGVLIFGSMMLLCGFLGSVGTFVYLTGRLPMCCCTRRSGRGASVRGSSVSREHDKARESYSGISLPERNGRDCGDEGVFEDEEPHTSRANGEQTHGAPTTSHVPATVYGSATESTAISPTKAELDDSELI